MSVTKLFEIAALVALRGPEHLKALSPSALAVWLLVKGVDVTRWNARAQALADGPP